MHEGWRCRTRNRLVRWLEYRYEGHVVLKRKVICMEGYERQVWKYRERKGGDGYIG